MPPLSSSQTANFSASYAELGAFFSRAIAPTPVAAPQWIAWNVELANKLGLSGLTQDEALDIFSGNECPSWAHPIAQAYAGHQFGHFVPQLGDGRAVLLTELTTREPKAMFDLQLKGSGPTPFSRGGDGRSALGPVLREYLVSEAMHALGVPTTRALAAIATGEWVYRDEALPGAVFTRVAQSHIRVGTFQYAAVHGGPKHVKILADYVIARHFPALLEIKPDTLRYRQFFHSVVQAQMKLVAEWQRVGFIHGVMNTDNTSICGDTIDYGPCAFMDVFRRNQTFSSIDRHGRYRYENQPRIAHWNMARFAETLLPLIHKNKSDAVTHLTALLQNFEQDYQSVWLHCMARKFGIGVTENSDTQARIHNLIEQFLTWLEVNERDFTCSFTALTDCYLHHTEITADLICTALEADPNDEVLTQWIDEWLSHLSTQQFEQITERMTHANPRRIPRNHQIAAAIFEAEHDGDLSRFHRLLRAWASPYADIEEFRDLEQPPAPDQQVTRTFCGT